MLYVPPKTGQILMQNKYQHQPNFLHFDIIDHLIGRFVLTNISQKSMLQMFDNLQDAYWFFSDYMYTNLIQREKYNLVQLTENQFIEQCLIRLQQLNFIPKYLLPYKLIKSYRQYQMSIPVCGGILINEARTHVLMIQKDQKWSLPKGKVNSIYETYTDCAVREINEEVGFLCPDKPVECVQFMNKTQLNVFFIIKNVPSYYPFHTKTIGEIDHIEWIPISQISTFLPIKYAHLTHIIKEKSSY